MSRNEIIEHSVRGYEFWGYGAPSAPTIAQALADAVLELWEGKNR